MKGPIVAVGLGNPGQRYARTRHNLGSMVVDKLAGRMEMRWRDASSYAETDREICARPLKLIKPITYMNSSGLAVAEVVRRLDLDLGSLLVILDDLYLPLGTLRLRRGGSDGGHRGLASVIRELGSTEVPRLRLGIGTPTEAQDRIEYVLSDFEGEETRVVEEMTEAGADVVVSFLRSGIERAMNEANAGGMDRVPR